MDDLLLSDLKISKITLGTVQFGMPYGIANRTGMPDVQEAEEIIAAAFEGGITSLDTASAYGTSEEVIGTAIDNLKIKDQITVITKVPSAGADASDKQAAELFETALNKSIKRLKIDPLPLVLIHDETNIPFLDQLINLKQKGMVKHIGASVQYTRWAKEAMANAEVEAIQWPGSMLDMRFEREDLYRKAENKCAVFLRSIYLQGLLVMQDADTPEHLKCVIPIRSRMREIAEELGIGIQEMALRYGLGLRGCTSVVVGVESVEQMKSNIDVLAKGPLSPETVQTIKDAVPELSEGILLPVNWSRIKNQ